MLMIGSFVLPRRPRLPPRLRAVYLTVRVLVWLRLRLGDALERRFEDRFRPFLCCHRQRGFDGPQAFLRFATRRTWRRELLNAFQTRRGA